MSEIPPNVSADELFTVLGAISTNMKSAVDPLDLLSADDFFSNLRKKLDKPFGRILEEIFPNEREFNEQMLHIFDVSLSLTQIAMKQLKDQNGNMMTSDKLKTVLGKRPRSTSVDEDAPSTKKKKISENLNQFKCKQCDFTTSIRFHFNRHMESHARFPCSGCDRAFNTERQLNKHVTNAHPEL